jgi:hypothetical protein
MKNEESLSAFAMNTPLFDRTMVVKLFAVFTLLGTVVAVLPIPRFNADSSVGLEPTSHRETTAKFAAIEQAW